jgi:hypothetical protein
MITALRLTQFRAFRTLRVEGLTRVNLILGGNNAGKTCILEAAEILMAGGQPWVLLRSPTRRGDGFLPNPENSVRPTVDIRHLFFGHALQPESSFRIDGVDSDVERFVQCTISTVSPEDDSSQADFPLIEALEAQPGLSLEISGDRVRTPRSIPLLPLGGGLLIDRASRRSPGDDESEKAMNFVSTNDPEYRLAVLWDRIVLTPEEQKIVQALQIIEPRIERIAALSRPSVRNAPSGIVVKLRGSDDRIPIGTMGDGVKRLLVLTVNLVNSAGGCLFVDEIDTGLHHSVMTKMWQLIIETARVLDVQVFATTHSLDCVRAMASMSELMPAAMDEVSIHRVERSSENSIRYGVDEALIAVKQEMEIR